MTFGPSVLERFLVGWKIRCETRSAPAFIWERPDGSKGDPLTESEHWEMDRLTRSNSIGETSEVEGDPPYALVTLL